MYLSTEVATALEATTSAATNHNSRVEEISERVTILLKDDAVRHAVLLEAAEDLDEVSMMEVHTILDALVSVIGGSDD